MAIPVEGFEVDILEFTKNRLQFPLEQLARYAGKYVAWNPDGRSIIASDEDLIRLDAAVTAAGYDPSQVLISSVPEEDVILGGGIME
jgi:hypothetical protein